MLGVILTVLKIIGIFILFVFSLILLAILAVLFAPVRYRVSGSISSKEKKYLITGKITWLLGALKVIFSEDRSMVLKICGFKVFKADLSTGSKNKKDKDKNKEDSDKDKEEKYKSKKAKKKIKGKAKKKAKDSKKSGKKYKFTKENFFEFIQSPNLEPGVRSALHEIFVIIKEVFPKYMEGNFELGFEDPDKTGIIYGVICILQTRLKGMYRITPNFEEEILFGDFTVKGRIFIIIILRSSIKLIFNRDLKKLISNFEVDKENK